MEIVINVPESVLDIIYKDKTLNDEQLAILHRCIRNGTPLPKGHGDLIDRRELKKDVYTTTEWNGDVHRIIYEASVDDAPTIIPADTESGGEE